MSAQRGRSSDVTAFDEAMGEVIAPVLAGMGFRRGRGRAFRRLAADGSAAQLVEFQLGQRALAGRFTVNLGVFLAADAPGVAAVDAREYHCAPHRRSRLGMLAAPRHPRLAAMPLVGAVFGPKDRWWPVGGGPDRAARSLSAVRDLLVAHGLPWLQRMSPEHAFAPVPLRGAV